MKFRIGDEVRSKYVEGGTFIIADIKDNRMYLSTKGVFPVYISNNGYDIDTIAPALTVVKPKQDEEEFNKLWV